MSEKPLVSIIIPTYNRANIVSNAIKSALNQSYPNKQIIVVDDGSTDNTAELVKNFKDVLYFYKPNGGQASARNAGLKHSTGTYIASLDSDDIWAENFLEKCVNTLESHQLDFVFANWNQQSDGGEKDFLSSYPLLQPYLHEATNSWVMLKYENLRELYTKGCPSPSSSVIMRSSLITSGWNENMHIGDDWCMLLDVILSSKIKAAFTTEKLWYKNINCNNIYDGRNRIEVNKLLNVADTYTILSRHKQVLTDDEFSFLEKKYLKGLVISATHSLFYYANFTESISLFKQAIKHSPLHTSFIISKLMVRSFRKRFIKVWLN